MNWLTFTIIGYFLYAVTAITDKFLLKKNIPHPAAYVFYVGVMSAFSMILLPFDFTWIGWGNFLAGLALGGIFLGAVYAFIVSIKNREVSRMATLIGGATPIFTLFLSFFFFGERLSASQLVAVIFLIIGGIIISIKINGRFFHVKEIPWISIAWALAAAFFFAVYYVLAKDFFQEQRFIPAFAFSRLGSFLVALFFLLVPAYRREIFSVRKTAGVGGGSLFVINKILAALSFIALNYAVKLGSVSLVNALQGSQFVFLLGFTVLLSKKYPHILKEELDKRILWQKVLAIALILAGLFLLHVWK